MIVEIYIDRGEFDKDGDYLDKDILVKVFVDYAQGASSYGTDATGMEWELNDDERDRAYDEAMRSDY